MFNILIGAIAVLAGTIVFTSQAMPGGDILRLDPALDSFVSSSARVETFKSDYFGYAEGPVWVPEGPSGFWLFSDMAGNRIYKRVADGTISVFLDRAGFTGTTFPDVRILNNGRLSVVILGTNGLTLDREGRLVMCAHGDRALIRLEKDRTRTVLAASYQGKRINGPNDVTMKSDGSFYFTDRGSAMLADSGQRELPYTALFRLHEGQLQVLDTDPQVNGLGFSPDEKSLYVTGGQRIRRFDVRPDGTITNPTVFVDMGSDKMRGNADGMKVDRHGNLFASGPGGVWVVSPRGTLLGKILTPEAATNVAFGDPDGKGLLVTSARSVFYVRLDGKRL